MFVRRFAGSPKIPKISKIQKKPKNLGKPLGKKSCKRIQQTVTLLKALSDCAFNNYAQVHLFLKRHRRQHRANLASLFHPAGRRCRVRIDSFGLWWGKQFHASRTSAGRTDGCRSLGQPEHWWNDEPQHYRW
jgi:hypothetical protein